MAFPTLVAKKVIAYAGSLNGTSTIPLTSGWNTSYGSATFTPIEGDTVIVSNSVPRGTDVTIDPTTNGYTKHIDGFQTATINTNLWVHSKVMGATPDTDVVVPRSGGNSAAQVVLVEVWRNVGAITTGGGAGGTANTRGNPASFNPGTGDRTVVGIYGAGAATATTALAQAALTAFLSLHSVGTQDAVLATGYVNHTGGAIDLAVATGGNTAADASWYAACLGLTYALFAPTDGKIKVRISTSWVAKPVMVRIGTSWVEKPLKRWSGSDWVLAKS